MIEPTRDRFFSAEAYVEMWPECVSTALERTNMARRQRISSDAASRPASQGEKDAAAAGMVLRKASCVNGKSIDVPVE